MALQVDQDRAVGQPLVDRPVVDAEHRRRRQLGLGGAADQAQQGVGADRHPELGRQARPASPPRARARSVSGSALAVGPAGGGRGDPASRSAKIRRGQAGLSQKNLRTWTWRRTATPAHGRSASVRA